MNKAILIGNLTRDPEFKQTPGGNAVCTFTIAVSRRFANQQGERQADFIPIVTWRKLADNCAAYLHKGSNVAVAGEIRTRSYEAPDGSKRYVTEVVADEVKFLTSRQTGQQEQAAPDELPDFNSLPDDDLPF